MMNKQEPPTDLIVGSATTELEITDQLRAAAAAIAQQRASRRKHGPCHYVDQERSRRQYGPHGSVERMRARRQMHRALES